LNAVAIEEERMPSAIEEKDAIREVLAEYCFRLDGGRYDDMAALFSEDGTWETAFGKATGRPAIAQLARDIRANRMQEGAGDNRPRAIHLVTNIAIALDGERAEIRSNWTVVQNSPDGPKIGSGGGYADRMVKQAGRWLFHHRKIDRFIAA
jgi:3-phenylpropionate/cinnamic acid dioxygenase small subunit